MRLTHSNQALAQHLTRLLDGADGSRMDIAKRMGVADGTLGRIKYGTGNPTIEVLDRIAHYFRVEPWELLRPTDAKNLREQQGDYLGAEHRRLHDWIDGLSDDQRRGLLQFIGS